MAIKTGKQYIDSLRDGRRLYIDGKVVSDVTAYPPLQGVIDTIASLCDDQHDPALPRRADLQVAHDRRGGEHDLSRGAHGARSSRPSPAAFTCARCAPSA